jgi:uncharacterized membrane protein
MANLQKSNAQNRITIIVLFAAFIFLRFPNFALVDHRWSDINLYSMLAKNIISGQTPYIDFTLEYPPLALVFFYIPGMISSIIGNFDLTYRLFMMLFDIGCLLLVGGIVKRLLPGQARMAAFSQIIYLALTAILFQVLYDRFDIAVAFLILLAVYLAIRGNWPWAYIVVILGAFAKLFPALILPLLIIYQVRRGRTAYAIRDFGISLVTGLALLIISIAFFGDWWGYMLEYHGRRGIQIESLYASIAMLANFAGVEAAIGHEYGAFQISNAFTAFMAKASMIFIGCSVLAVYIIFVLKTRESKNKDSQFVWAALIALSSFAIFNKVLSPQFFLWLFPLASIMLATSPRRAPMAILWTAAALATAIIFPYLYRSLVALESFPVTLLVARNACFVATATLGLMALLRPLGGDLGG